MFEHLLSNRPRRRSGDQVAAAPLDSDLSNTLKIQKQCEDSPENLSLKRSSKSPDTNLDVSLQKLKKFLHTFTVMMLSKVKMDQGNNSINVEDMNSENGSEVEQDLDQNKQKERHHLHPHHEPVSVEIKKFLSFI